MLSLPQWASSSETEIGEILIIVLSGRAHNRRKPTVDQPPTRGGVARNADFERSKCQITKIAESDCPIFVPSTIVPKLAMAGTDQPRKRAAKRQARKDEAKRPAQKDAAVRWGEADVLDVYPLIKAFTASLMSNPAQAEDAAHAAVLGIVAGLPTVEARTKAKFRSWCFQIARNKIKDIYRSKHVSRTDSLDEEDVRRMVEAGFGGGELPAAIKVDLDFFLGKLREARFPCVELLYDHFLNGESYEELGKEMGISASAVRMQVNRCWGTLQKIAAKYS